jgi:hypothetical protein
MDRAAGVRAAEVTEFWHGSLCERFAAESGRRFVARGIFRMGKSADHLAERDDYITGRPIVPGLPVVLIVAGEWRIGGGGPAAMRPKITGPPGRIATPVRFLTYSREYGSRAISRVDRAEADRANKHDPPAGSASVKPQSRRDGVSAGAGPSQLAGKRHRQ